MSEHNTGKFDDNETEPKPRIEKNYISETSEQNADKPKDIKIKSKTSFEKKESYQLSRSGSVNKK